MPRLLVSVRLAVASSVEIEIFNILGERVYSTTFTDAAANNIQHTWDLLNNSGKKVGSGLYLVKVKATGGGKTVETIKKVVIIQ